jgi:hypothetical protein
MVRTAAHHAVNQGICTDPLALALAHAVCPYVHCPGKGPWEGTENRPKRERTEREPRPNLPGKKSGRQIKEPKRFEPPALDSGGPAKKRIKLQHDFSCFNCLDGGNVLECTVCPRVYHLACAGLSEVPKGSWHCPWHGCWTCGRKSSAAGGMLFHCLSCVPDSRHT